MLKAFSIQQQAPDHGNAGDDEDAAINLIEDMNIMGRKAVADLPGQKHLGHIGGEYKGEADDEGEDPLLDSIPDDRGGCHYPEGKNAGVECVHQETGEKHFRIVSFPEFEDLLAGFIHPHLFKEEKVYAQGNEEGASRHSHLGLDVADTLEEFGEYVADEHKGDITRGNAEYKGHSSAWAVVEALLDDRKKDRAD